MFQYLCSVTLEHQSGLAIDRVVNTFCFESDVVALAADADTILARLETFYKTTGEAGTHPVAYYLSSAMSRTVKPIMRMYDITAVLNGDPMGSPRFTRNFVANLPAGGGGTNFPAEIAACLSFHGDYGLDVEFLPGERPRSRDRGRVYIGPLTTDCAATAAAGRMSLSTMFRTDLVGAGKDLRDANSTIRWAVWSRKAARTTPVTLCSVDDAFDVQRRRGEKPVVKTVL